jgi:hypothetical protein
LRRSLLAASLLAIGLSALADGPGSRLRIGPALPQQPAPAAERDLQRCEKLRADERERCLKDLRAAAAADERTRGPGSVGGTPSAGSGATTGTSGGGTVGGAAAR